MTYKHTYKDWEEGRIIWNSVESNKYEKDYISEDCKAKIKQKQEDVFNTKVEYLITHYIENYNLNRRSDTNRASTVNKFIKTIDNLFNGNVDLFEDTLLIDEEKALTETITHKNYRDYELKNKVIPPLNWVHLNKNDIQMIQSVFLEFHTSGKWNYEVVQTPIEEEIWKYVEFSMSVHAKAYYEFSKRLRQYEGVISNTFQSKLSYYKLTNLRIDLIKSKFLDKETNRELFVKAFQGYYLMKHERLNWLKNLDCLNYLIKQLDKKLTHQKEYGKWEVATNCFVKDFSVIKPDTLRKATKINDYPNEKQQLDNIIASLK